MNRYLNLIMIETISKGNLIRNSLFIFVFTLTWASLDAQVIHQDPIYVDKASGELKYEKDHQGNRIPDFSYCGYKAGNDSIPDVAIRIIVPPQTGDATREIQAAINYVSTLPKDEEGYRGAVLLKKGTYRVSGRLKIDSSGVVLRGSGMSPKGTRLIAAGKDRTTLINILGKKNIQKRASVKIVEAHVPVGSKRIRVADGSAFHVGDRIMVRRPTSQKWIDSLKMDSFGGETGWLGWKPGEEDVVWDRKIVKKEGNEITLNIALTTALDSSFGGGAITAYNWSGRIKNIGIENLRLISDYDSSNSKDEAHAWMGITFENTQDAWVRQVVFKHFAGSAVFVLNTSRRITVQDCKSLAPVSEIGGERRYTFRTDGQQTLFQRLYAEYGYHDYTVGYCAAGPNAFVQCKSYLPHSFSGPMNSWASGVLYDNVRVDGGALVFKNMGQDNHGAGWNAANSVFWQCDAARIICQKPPTAQNWAIGCWSQPGGNGYWGHTNEHVHPFSLYYGQLKERLGRSPHAELLQIKSNPTSSPTVKEAAHLTALAEKPGPRLKDWIDDAAKRDPIPIEAAGAESIDQIDTDAYLLEKEAPSTSPIVIKKGWITIQGQVVTGGRTTTPWWRGDIEPKAIKKAKPAITRFVPGRIGHGLTDDLRKVTDSLREHDVITFEQNYGLWYDRRRDDHQRVRRMNGNVWAPFYVLPFARSGKELAWDGLSKYDLTKYNHWYWSRLKQFADLADQKGLVLFHKNYFQHNILEAGAHWVDFPWRSANNINHTGFPEPVPFAGDKRQFMAKQFYDTTNAVRKGLHIAYIDKCLDNFKDNSNVIQFTSAEYTGPLSFMQFWVDAVKSWEQKTGKEELIGLSATKDVQDAILKDPDRSPIIDVIDIREWHYEKDSSLYAPKGGKYLAPRQWARLLHPRGSSFSQVYRAVKEYKEKYPDKAVIYSYRNYSHYGWAVFMAGGSLASIPEIQDARFLKDAAQMTPVEKGNAIPNEWMLANPKVGYIIYPRSSGSISINLRNVSGSFILRKVNPKTGEVSDRLKKVKGGRSVTLNNKNKSTAIYWLSKK